MNRPSPVASPSSRTATGWSRSGLLHLRTSGRTSFASSGLEGDRPGLRARHERRLHLIVAGRSPSKAFLHLHPEQRNDGSWETPLIAGARLVPGLRGLHDRRRGAPDARRRPRGADGPEAAAEALALRCRARSRRWPADVPRHRGRHPSRSRSSRTSARAAASWCCARRPRLRPHADVEDELLVDVPFPGEGRYSSTSGFRSANGSSCAFRGGRLSV